jgi:hypothetical protein
MADSNVLTLAYVRESTWGTTPNSALQAIQVVSGSMTHGQQTVRSQTIRNDAQNADAKRVGVTPSAAYNFEFMASNYDEWLRGAIRSDADWSTAVAGSCSDVTVASPANTYTSAATDITLNVTKGQWVYVEGFTEAANNGWKKVTSTGTRQLTVAQTLAAEASGDAVTFKSAQIRNGSTLHSYTLCHKYADVSSKFHVLTGARPNAVGLSMSPGGIITGNIGFDGKARAQAAAIPGTGSITAVSQKDVASEVSGFDGVWVDNTALTVDILDLSFNVAVPTRGVKPLGSIYNSVMNLGSVTVTGKLRMYLNTNEWVYDTKWENFTAFALAFGIDMGTDGLYLFEFPQCHFTGEPGNVPGMDSDIVFDFDWEAEPGGSYGSSSDEKTIQICRKI